VPQARRGIAAGPFCTFCASEAVATAFESAPKSSSGTNGFVRQAAAPARSTSAAVSLSATAVSTTTGTSFEAVIRPELAENFVAVHHGHHQVEHDRVGWLTLSGCEASKTVVRQEYLVALQFEGQLN
jgi:hypothetical protein